MELSELLSICLTAFGAVFVLLIVLALTIRLITYALPERAPKDDAAVIAAITAAVGHMVPGARVTQIREET